MSRRTCRYSTDSTNIYHTFSDHLEQDTCVLDNEKYKIENR